MGPLLGPMFSEADRGPVLGGVVGHQVDAAAADDSDPGPGQDAHRMGTVAAPGGGAPVDVRRPGAVVTELSAKVVTASRKRVLQAQRKCTAECLPEALVTGVSPAIAATASTSS